MYSIIVSNQKYASTKQTNKRNNANEIKWQTLKSRGIFYSFLIFLIFQWESPEFSNCLVIGTMSSNVILLNYECCWCWSFVLSQLCPKKSIFLFFVVLLSIPFVFYFFILFDFIRSFVPSVYHLLVEKLHVQQNLDLNWMKKRNLSIGHYLLLYCLIPLPTLPYREFYFICKSTVIVFFCYRRKNRFYFFPLVVFNDDGKKKIVVHFVSIVYCHISNININRMLI